MTPIQREVDEQGYRYHHVEVQLDHRERTATLIVRAPQKDGPFDLISIHAAGADWWPLAMARELDDAILMLRTNNPDLGLILLRTEGDPEGVLAADSLLIKFFNDWFVREVIGFLRRTLSRLDVSSRSLFALMDEGSCFVGTCLLYTSPSPRD